MTGTMLNDDRAQQLLGILKLAQTVDIAHLLLVAP